MCGIAGFVRFTNHVALAKDNACIQQHRGPDAQDTWHDAYLSLAHQRLSIIDLDPRSNQPMVKNGLVIVFNGEIYNYRELKDQVLTDHPEINFSTTSDTEVLLELYRLKKEKCLDDLVGMFAFAIYETETGQVFIARDQFGIKPVFYTAIGNALAFSSELKMLMNIPGFDRGINRKALVGSINYLWVPGNETMFLNCYKLPPAHYLSFNARTEHLEPVIKRYWELDTSIRHVKEEETVDLLDKTVLSSIERHMVADVPVSSFLSGGLDSSLISVLAARMNPNLSTYTIATDARDKKTEQMPEDEKYALSLARQFGFDHHEIVLKPDIVQELPRMVYSLDEPIGDPAAINTYLICKAAREKGVKVLLSGMGADEVFFGYRRQKATLLSLRYKKIPGVLRRPLEFLVQSLPVKFASRGIRLTRWAKRFLGFASLPLEEAYMRSYSYYDKKGLQELFRADIGDDYQVLRQEHAAIFNRHYQSDPVNQMCFTDIHLFMLGLNLTYTDRASMAASVEVRVPFIDKKLIEMAMQVDGSLKFKKGTSKYILKKMAERYLPHEIIYRPKASFGAPIRSWISGDLKPMVDDLLSERAVEQRGFFNYPFVKQLIDEDRKGIEDHAYRIYQLLTLELWCRRFLDTDNK
jgi:asparagine synthase (glutamine-hydrolysing)